MTTISPERNIVFDGSHLFLGAEKLENTGG